MIFVLLHEIPFLTDIGLSATMAANALAFTGAFGGAGKVVLGRLTDWISTRDVVAICFGLQGLGVFILLLTRNIPMLCVFTLVFGFSMGGALALLPLSVGDLFGPRSFGTIYGLVHFATLGGSMLGPPFAGVVYDITGSYFFALILFLISYAFAIFAICLAWKQKGIQYPKNLKSPPFTPFQKDIF